jgi:hypothetical protein
VVEIFSFFDFKMKNTSLLEIGRDECSKCSVQLKFQATSFNTGCAGSFEGV